MVMVLSSHQNVKGLQADNACLIAIGGEGGAIFDVDIVDAVFVAHAVPCDGIGSC